MKASTKYAGTAAAVVVAVTAGLWPFLEPSARRGVLVAAAVALPTQIVAFDLLMRYRGRVNGFLAAWIGGTVARFAVVGLLAFLAIRAGMEGSVAMLFALVGFFFALLLVEPFYFGSEPGEPAR